MQLVIPKFDGYYDHRSMLMKIFIISIEFWNLIEDSIPKIQFVCTHLLGDIIIKYVML